MISDMTYRALYLAARRVGEENYKAQLRQHLRRKRKASTFRFSVTPEHRELIDAMGNRGIGDDEAMSLLHQYDTFLQRFPH